MDGPDASDRWFSELARALKLSFTQLRWRNRNWGVVGVGQPVPGSCYLLRSARLGNYLLLRAACLGNYVSPALNVSGELCISCAQRVGVATGKRSDMCASNRGTQCWLSLKHNMS